ncbi:hypothetical protein DICPUDRAFT_26886 [Dictyostelium purpureum]|uniref:EGF-like domain-containing protein n=1 Tax=Dictyostelium purpureum TaxID=5786 RepID=F0Z9D5_DICPU|nr:uncharacterized protein DICPUDRAFT_26886 [Dictyostelium purpureum]EGC39456.1 hypothetical protein DICPUDRAFT_26886 [Dictyostelium purpureum]|eukprot:XP_003284014.1 hypothetical protein DICPUDRAFT_26886 [Dictyostelium purpureum]
MTFCSFFIGPYDQAKKPVLKSIETIFLKDDIFLFRVSIRTPYQFNSILFNQKERFGIETLVSGDTYEGVYEFTIPSVLIASIMVYDIYNGKVEITTNKILSISPNFIYFVSPYIIKDYVTNHRHYNVLYFNYTDIPRNSIISMIDYSIERYHPTLDFKDNIATPYFHSTYNYTIQMFQIEFYIEANSPIGNFNFFLNNEIVFVTKELFSNRLRIKKSNMDLQGPIFKEIKKITSNEINNTNKFAEIGWTMAIEDPINGFRDGFVVIKGEIDQSIYNISVSFNNVKNGGNKFLGEYDFKFNLTYPCISQQYIISEVVLTDVANRKSVFAIFPSYFPSSLRSASNPFLYFLNDTNINTIQVQCSNHPSASADTTAPVLKSFISSKTTIDVSALDRNVTFTFVAEDLESGLKANQYPIVYLTIYVGQYIECKSSIIEITQTNATYSCTIQLPVGFGYSHPNVILLSVYGFINNNGILSGFSTQDLINFNNDMFHDSLEVTYNFASNQPILIDYLMINDKGGDLIVSGVKFNRNIDVYFNFKDGSVSTANINVISSTKFRVSDVKATKDPYQIYIKSSNINSNTITVTPVVYDYYLHGDPEPTFPPTVTPVPTNKPQQCKGNPTCGGPTNGKCIANQGCVCYSPWVGIDCQSQIVIIDPPIFNNGSNNSTSPSIDIVVPDKNNTNGNNNTTPITYHSLISIVSLREINIQNEVVNTITFKDDWLSKQIDDSTIIFYKEFTKSTTDATTNITVTLKWFKNQTTISFAQEQLLMNPSTLKYTIEISNYPFENSLNQLELVMSASMQSNTTDDICSAKEFGETTNGDNSNYLKIQVDNYSLYGRFIRRGIIDSTIRTISNILLDKDMNPITSSKSLQSYIGIQIPYYKESAIIDPDFSILIDSNKASSICSNKSKLSGAKLAGIIIGCVAFIAVITISIIYHLKKKKMAKEFTKGMNQKMKQMNDINKDNL